jgi:hypothetical protein
MSSKTGSLPAFICESLDAEVATIHVKDARSYGSQATPIRSTRWIQNPTLNQFANLFFAARVCNCGKRPARRRH